MAPTSEPCPCGLPATYAGCCGRFHAGQDAAATAEQLMRSRYAAFVVGDTAYLLRTWHSSTRPLGLQLVPDRHWTGLTILGTSDGSPFHSEGTVEFRADHQAGAQYENSYFTRENGAWVYVSPVD
ncbi:hypothetical protein HPO96_00930 [Kribbella sandramycini]|uniref:UPF0225 protein HNR71_004253 n=1 Tax=Kribbella sandramycini TaxID=60450 RepID=A0A7Y4KUJ2_9ACTN|nr:YchJ family metal-binding protein [Kribbella sandramycini]MBB6568616.1 SEC-C motif-containing protein [Kribbella sandramycini]NOL38799.1 hypothetical protein [Kribbella sandramycini]